jgi:site-specific recombinase XerD
MDQHKLSDARRELSSYMKRQHTDPVSAAELARRTAISKAFKRRLADPVFAARHRAASTKAMKRLNANPEIRAKLVAKNREAMKRLFADPVFRAKLSAVHADPQFKAKARENMKRLNARAKACRLRLRGAALELFGVHLDQFLQHLVEQNHQESTVKRYSSCIVSLAEIMNAGGIALDDLGEAQAVELVARTSWTQTRKIYSTSIVRCFIRFLAERGVGQPVPPPTAKAIARAELRQDYETYLRRQRGLSERSIPNLWRVADSFLEFRFGEETGDLSRITPADIVGFLQQMTTRKAPLRCKNLCSHLRNLFRYLFRAGKTAANLSLAVPKVAQRYGTRLPRHLTAEQVNTLVRAVRTDSIEAVRRNYAMVLLLARLGLRASEVVTMQLDDIDWRSGEVIVRGKGKRHDRVPLPTDVGEALADYIRSDRKTESRTLFVTTRPPHRPFKDAQVLNLILKSAFSRTGLKPPVPYVGSHILRHSLATNLLQCGAPLDEIGDMLRHRSRRSTMLYAKLDIDGLRSVTQSWPVAGGVK